MKDGYTRDLQTSRTIKLYQKLIDKTKNGKMYLVMKGYLVQCNLVDNQYQQKSEVLYVFMPKKSYIYLLNFEPSSLVFLEISIIKSSTIKYLNY